MISALLVALLAAPVPAESRQMVLVESAHWDAIKGVARLYERAEAGHPWRSTGEAVTVSLGRSGLAWGRGLHDDAGREGPRKREGDGRSPAGVFHLREMTGYAAEPPDGAPAGSGRSRLAYRPATSTLRCVDDPASRFYNQLVDQATVAKDWASAEDMRRGDALYRLVVWVGHNDAPAAPHGGSCIFLHLRSDPDATTAGCTAFDERPLEHLVRWLDPAAQPVLVQLPRPEREALAAAWALPRE